MKKITKIFFITIFTIILLAFGFTWWKMSSELNAAKSCPFCNPVVLQTHTFYEDDLVRGLCSHKPIQSGHCLVVPKRHIERFEETSSEEVQAIGRLLKKINAAMQTINGPSSYLILQKNGKEVGQTVPHVHVHYIPKREEPNKSIAVFGLLWNFFVSIFQRPMSDKQLKKNVEMMKHALHSL